MDYKFSLVEPSDFKSLILDEKFDGFSYCIVNDYLYLFGGGDEQYNCNNKKIMYIYDIINDSWEKKIDNNIPDDIMNAATLEHSGDIYFFGGYKTNVIRKYRTYTDEWLPYNIGYVPTNTGIDCKSQYYASKPFVKDNIAYLAPYTTLYVNLQGNTVKYDLNTETIDNTLVGNIYGQSNTYFEFYNNDSSIFQYMRTVNDSYIGCITKGISNYNYNAGYNQSFQEYTTKYFPGIVTKIGEDKILDIRQDFSNNNRITIKILNSNESFIPGCKYEDVEQIEHYFEDKIYTTFGSTNSYSIKDSKDRIIVPFFTSEDKNEIKLFMISTPQYIINSDQTIETTTSNQIIDICDVINVSIDYELEDNTQIKIAVSTDNKNSYKYFDGISWKVITDKNLNKNGEGMTPNDFSNLSKQNFRDLFGTSTSNNLDILISLYSTNSDNTPKIRNISIKTSNLL